MDEARTPLDYTVRENGRYLLGYARYRKSGCEIYNYISSTFRIVRIVQGCARWQIDGGIEELRQGDIALFCSLNRRSISQVLTGTVTYEIFDFPPNLLDERVKSAFYVVPHRLPAADERLDRLLDWLRDEACGGQEMSALAVRELIQLIGLVCLRLIPAAAEKRSATLDTLSRCVQYITEHLAEPLTVPMLATLCGYNPEYFSRLFRSFVGLSPVQYIIEARIDNALRLSSEQGIPLLEAAYQSGFRSSSAFYKTFAAYRGCPPGKYLNHGPEPAER